MARSSTTISLATEEGRHIAVMSVLGHKNIELVRLDLKKKQKVYRCLDCGAEEALSVDEPRPQPRPVNNLRHGPARNRNIH